MPAAVIQVSAFAAARARQQQLTTKDDTSPEPVDARGQMDSPISPAVDPNAITSDIVGETDPEEADPPGEPVQDIVLSTWQPNGSNILSSTTNGVTLLLKPAQTITLIGQYAIRVLTGTIKLCGAIVPASPKSYTIFAPSTHALPVVQCIGGTSAELEFTECQDTMFGLEKLSPLFSNIWNLSRTPGDGAGTELDRRTFSYMRMASHDALNRPVYPLEIPASWQRTLDAICALDEAAARRVYVVCGPKASGKSTFSRVLVNRLLSAGSDASLETPERLTLPLDVYWLDLDPGQPEFTPSGQLSLIKIHRPIFGPPFSHDFAMDAVGQRIVRSHSLASTVPTENTSYFQASILDLREIFLRETELSGCSALVVNCPGWRGSEGLSLMGLIVKALSPSHVIHMGEAPADFSDLCRTYDQAPETIPIYDPSAQPHKWTTRTSAEFRALQMMSYFHQQSSRGGSATWNALPLTHQRPWVVPYGSGNTGIYILLAGQSFPPHLLATMLDGSIVAVVVVDDSDGDAASYDDGVPRPGGHAGQGDRTSGSGPPRSPKALFRCADTISGSSLPTRKKPPDILRTPSEGLPYVKYDCAKEPMPLDPKTSRTVGLAIVRGIDVNNQNLHILTPIAREAISDLQQPGQGIRSRVVLVLGSIDTPGWAYQEDVFLAAYGATRKRSKSKAEDSSGESDGEDEVRIPWVKRVAAGERSKSWGMKRRMRRFIYNKES